MQRKRGNRGQGTVYEDKQNRRWIGEVTKKGVRHKVTARTKTEARLLLKPLVIELETKGQVQRRDIEKVGSYLTAWVETRELATSTMLRYKQLLGKHVLPSAVGQLSMSEIDTADIIAYYGVLRATQSDSTRKKVHNLLHTAFEAARHERPGFVRNPCDLQRSAKPKYRPGEKNPFDAEKEAAFLDAIRDDEFEALYMLALDAGMRQGELFALEWRDIEWAKSTVEVCRTLKDSANGLITGLTKNKQRRSILVSESTIEAFQRHRRKQSTKSGFGRLIFPSQTGGFLSRQNFNSRAFARALSAAARHAPHLNFGGHTFHDLRHTMASLLLHEGESITRVSQRLGHASVKITLDTYASCMPQDEDRPAARFESRRKKTNPQLDPQRRDSPTGT